MELKGNFFTVKEIAEKLGIDKQTAKMRLFRLGISPIASDALYPESALEAIRNVPGKGRPKKPVEPEPPSKPRKLRK